MKIFENYSLLKLNTFGINVSTDRFTEISTREELIQLIKSGDFNREEVLFLGGGSNLLFAENFKGLVVKVNPKGIEMQNITNEFTQVKVLAGEKWEDFVDFCVENNWGGLENLALIPGNVGTCPIQNIGAYGVEAKDCIHKVEAIDIKTGETKVFSNTECKFGYRSSIFKHEEKGNYVIWSVTFRFKTKHELNLEYGVIRQEIEKQGIKKVKIKDVSESVKSIRRSKLPDPEELGNAGSFFKNPIVDLNTFMRLNETFPNLPSYPGIEGVKIAAGWLIEQAGFKGYRSGDAGVHEKQALVLVNYGSASGKEICELAVKIIKAVKNKFDIEIEPEVNIKPDNYIQQLLSE